jgi:hypothetical protein
MCSDDKMANGSSSEYLLLTEYICFIPIIRSQLDPLLVFSLFLLHYMYGVYTCVVTRDVALFIHLIEDGRRKKRMRDVFLMSVHGNVTQCQSC